MQSADDFEFRQITAADENILIELAESNPDGGDIQFAPHFEVNPYQVYSDLVPTNDFAGFLAETPGGDAAGMGFIAFNDARVGGELRKRGYLAGLIVDHDYRGMGLGKRLAAERIDYAEDQFGDDIAITAAIQTGNDPSMAVAQSWADDFPYEYVNQPIQPLETEPATEYEIRSLTDAEVPTFVSAVNDFYEDAEMFVPFESDQLAEMMETTVDGEYVHRCEVVVEDGEFVAGAHVADQYKLISAVVEELPPELEGAEELPPSIPEDLEMRPSFVMPWFESGHEDAAEALIQHERANVGDANRLMCIYDPEGPLRCLDPLTPDAGTVELNWAIRGLDTPVDDTFVAPGLG
jgi:GNAT superfamily N-acetyltransferase